MCNKVVQLSYNDYGSLYYIYDITFKTVLNSEAFLE